MDGNQLPQGYKSHYKEPVYFYIRFPEIPGTHLIHFKRMKEWANLGATQ